MKLVWSHKKLPEMNDLCILTANQQVTVTVKVETADALKKVENRKRKELE